MIGAAFAVRPPGELRTVARRWPARFGVRGSVCSQSTSARKRAIVSVLTATSTVASSSRISRSDAPFCRSSTMPFLWGISLACRVGAGGVNARTASLNRCVRAAMSAGSLMSAAANQRRIFGSLAGQRGGASLKSRCKGDPSHHRLCFIRKPSQVSQSG